MGEATETITSSSNCNDLPDGWENFALEDLSIRMFGGGTPSTKHPEYWDGEQPWTTSAVIQSDDIYLTRFQRSITQEGLKNSATKIAPTGSVLIGTRVGVGKAAVASFDVAISQDLTVLIPNKKVLSDFLVLSLKQPSIQTWFNNNKRGATIKGIPRKDLALVRIPVPPLPEQLAIAHVLRTVQQAKEATEKVVAASRQLKHSLLRHLFTYGPVPLDQADQVGLKETNFGPVPAKWKVALLRDCARVQTGVAKGRKISNDDSVRLPYLRVANVQDGYLDLTEIKHITIKRSEISRFSLQVGDVVLTEGGDFDKLGRGFIWKGEVPNCVHQNHIFAVRTDHELIMPEFFAYLAQSPYGKAYFLSVAHKTTNLACINATKLKAFPVLIPSRDEQKRVVEYLREVDRKQEVETLKLDRLGALFKSLLQYLMTGNIRMKNVDLPETKEAM